MKTLRNYFGHVISFPPQYKFVATDEDGDVWAFTYEPEFNDDSGVWWGDGYDGSDFYYIDNIELPPDVDWKDTLFKELDQ